MGEAAYSFAKEVDGTMACFFRRQVSSSLGALMAIDEMIVMGTQAGPELLQAEADAHHKDIGSISGSSGITSKAY